MKYRYFLHIQMDSYFNTNILCCYNLCWITSHRRREVWRSYGRKTTE